MGVMLMLMRNTTAARPFLLLLLPRHATAAKYHTVVPSLASASPAPPFPKPRPTTRACGFGGGHQRARRRPLFRNFVGLALGIGGTDGIF